MLWGEEVGVCGGGSDYYGGGDFDDIADNFVLLWYGVFNFGSCEFINFTDFAVCDGASVFNGGFCGSAFD